MENDPRYVRPNQWSRTKYCIVKIIPNPIAGNRTANNIGRPFPLGSKALGMTMKNNAATLLNSAHCLSVPFKISPRFSAWGSPNTGQRSEAAVASRVAALAGMRSFPTGGVPN